MNTTTRSRKSKDYTGQKFGRLTVFKEVNKQVSPCGSKKRMAICICDCGNERRVGISDLKSGHTKSCGCFKIDNLRQIKKTHGMSKSLEYKNWQHMKYRCFDKNYQYYEYYGGREITVCERWMKFENFFEDMGERPKGKTLDRKNNNGNYCKENCRWATPREQSNNTRRNRFIEYDGERRTVSQWARKLNIRPGTLFNRLLRGWSDERILTTPCK